MVEFAEMLDEPFEEKCVRWTVSPGSRKHM
jgi:hypothetical protein